MVETMDNTYKRTKRCCTLLRCPNCQSIDVGKIGVNQYYCWGCFIEMTIAKGKINTHQVEEDGSLSSLDDLFSDEDRTINF
jgi:hypothetical protein